MLSSAWITRNTAAVSCRGETSPLCTAVPCAQVYCEVDSISKWLNYNRPGVYRSRWVAGLVSNCSRPFVLSFPVQCSAKQGREELLTAAIEQGPSEGARSGSKESSSCPCVQPSEAARCASTEDHQAPSPSLHACSFILLWNDTRVRPDCGCRTSIFPSGAFREQKTDAGVVPPSFLAGPSPHPMPEQASPHQSRLSLTF